MNSEQWDERYRASELVWGIGPNRFVEQETAALPPGRALDLACGEGRNALWLAGRGWRVTGVDFSPVAIDKARQLDADGRVDWLCADVTTFRAEQPVDLVVVAYLQLPTAQRAAAMRAAADALAPGGVLFVVGHDSRNLAEGTGGPQDPAVLFTADDIVDDLADEFDGRLVVDRAEAVPRPVDGAPRPAIDALLRAHRPAS